jgi:hypothetical protein
MEPLTSTDYQQLIIHLIDASYAPFITLYGTIWAWGILERLMRWM